jgi:acyl-coenzyme A thioesterase PaaI-like protein
MDPAEMLLSVVPFVRTLGMEVTATTPTSVEVRLPMRPELANHVGTMHAAAQYALGETVTGALMFLIFQDQFDRIMPLNRASQIEYRRPSHGTLIARGELRQDAIDQVRAAFAQDGRAKFSLIAALYDESDLHTVVTTVTVDWVVMQRPAA